MEEEPNPLREEAQRELERLQTFDPELLVRREELGKYAFTKAVAPARRLVELAATLQSGHLTYFPDQQQTRPCGRIVDR